MSRIMNLNIKVDDSKNLQITNKQARRQEVTYNGIHVQKEGSSCIAYWYIDRMYLRQNYKCANEFTTHKQHENSSFK